MRAALLSSALLLVPAAVLPAQEPADLETLLARVRTYRFGGSRASLAALAQRVQKATPTDRVALARRLARELTVDATADAKRFLCRQLSLIGFRA